jgi:membrane-bound lytic murein transglycosylase MltF
VVVDGAAGDGQHSAADWRPLIDEALAATWLDLPDGWRWIVAQVHVESGGNPRAKSPAGAMGLLQLMPATAGELGVTNPFDPAENLYGGIRYLRAQYRALGEVPEHLDRLLWSFAAYNAGRGYLDFNGGPANTCLELAARDEPAAWWRWDVGRYWLMHRECVVRGRYPDYRQVWNYVARIRALAAGLGAVTRKEVLS